MNKSVTSVTLSLFYFITEVSACKMYLQGIMLWEFHTSLICIHVFAPFLPPFMVIVACIISTLPLALSSPCHSHTSQRAHMIEKLVAEISCPISNCLWKSLQNWRLCCAVSLCLLVMFVWADKFKSPNAIFHCLVFIYLSPPQC